MPTAVRLTKEQRHAIRCIKRELAAGEQIQTLGGFAGCGKTTCLAELAEDYPDFAPAAFTGKAANVMREKGMLRASTIHSLIYRYTGGRGLGLGRPRRGAP